MVYAIGQLYEFFHSTGAEMRDVVDMDARLAYYLVASENVKIVPHAVDKKRLGTFPTWSPDGLYLYYCSTPILWTDLKTIPPDRYAEVKYDLMRIRYDVATDVWGEPEMVLSASQTGMSNPASTDLAGWSLSVVLHVQLRELSRLFTHQRPVHDGSG